MCEYCGCQALTSIAALTSEHDALAAMIGEARAAATRADPDASAAVARRIVAVLGPHTRVEEDGLFPALAGEYSQHVAGLQAEHRRIEAILAEAVGGAPADPAWPARLLDAMRLLREHILKEQDGVFPAALISLSADDWDRVEQVRAKVSAAESAEMR